MNNANLAFLGPVENRLQAPTYKPSTSSVRKTNYDAMEIDTMMIIFCISVFASAGLLLSFFYVAERKDYWGWQIVGPLVISLGLIVISCIIVVQLSVGYYINEWAMLCLVPICFVAGIILLLIAFALASDRLLYGPLICLAPVIWCLCWDYYARPDGIWVWAVSNQAYSSLFIPDKAVNLTRQGPQRYSQAMFQIDFLSEQTTDQLLAFYTGKFNEAHFTLVGTEDDTMKGESTRDPCHVLMYRNTSGQRCNVWIYENPLQKGFEQYRRVTLRCFFDGNLLNPPASTI